MLVIEERQMLRWLAGRSGDCGCVVDAGAFLGGSTVHLADGIRDHPITRKKVHSFDLFKPSAWARKKYELGNVESTFSEYAANVAPWAERIIVYPGDIQLSNWPAEAIEILFLDVMKTPGVGDWVVHHFFPELVPGESIVIQQDMIHPHLPWIHVAMGWFGTHFSYLADTSDASVLYRLDRAISTDEAAAFRYDAIPHDEKLALFDSVAERFTEERQRSMLADARGRIA